MASCNRLVTESAIKTSAITSALAIAQTAAELGIRYGYDSDAYTNMIRQANSTMDLAIQLMACSVAPIVTDSTPCPYGEACRAAKCPLGHQKMTPRPASA